KRVDGRSRADKFQEQWIELKKIIRLPEQVAKISQEFSEIFNLNQDIKIGSILKPDLFNQFEAHVVWWNIGCSHRTWWIIRSPFPNPFRAGLFVLDRSDRPSLPQVRLQLRSSESSFTHSPRHEAAPYLACEPLK